MAEINKNTVSLSQLRTFVHDCTSASSHISGTSPSNNSLRAPPDSTGPLDFVLDAFSELMQQMMVLKSISSLVLSIQSTLP